MTPQTSTSLVPTSNEDAARAAVKAAVYAQAALPEEFRNKAPFGTDSRVARWFFDYMLPKLGFGSVGVESFGYSGTRQSPHVTLYHRVTIALPLRTVRFVVNSFGAFHLGRILLMIASALDDGHGLADIEFENFAGTGNIYVPRWAIEDVIVSLGHVVKAQQAHIQWAVDEVRRAQLPFLGTTDDDTQQQSSAPTLH